MGNGLERVKQLVKTKPVFVFMKGSPDFPQCGFSARAIEILRAAGVDDGAIGSVNVLEDQELRAAVKELTKVPTIPQIFVKGEFVGTGDIIAEMFESGELQEIVKN